MHETFVNIFAIRLFFLIILLLFSKNCVLGELRAVVFLKTTGNMSHIKQYIIYQSVPRFEFCIFFDVMINDFF